MAKTIYEKLLGRELGASGKPAKVLRDLYGDTAWVKDLDIVNELSGHRGCVNALSWSTSGQLLASGSDDTFLNIHIHLPQDSLSAFKLSTMVDTGHTANIFSVKFMPHSGDRTLITAAGDSQIRIFDIEYAGRNVGDRVGPGVSNDHIRRDIRFLHAGDANYRVFRSHSDRVKHIVTESSPYLFLSCSEDGTVRQWDLRQPSSAYPKPGGFRGRQSVSEEGGVVPPPLISYRRHHVDLNSISCSPSQPHYILLAGAHLHAFLHDRRMLGRDRHAERGASASSGGYSEHDDSLMSEATQCVRRFAPHGKKSMKGSDSGHITACRISDANPNEMVASWSGDWIYSFDLLRSPDARNTNETRADHARNRLKESPKRKRMQVSSEVFMEDYARAHPRAQSGPVSEQQDLEEQVSLRVRYGNGQSEDIPVIAPHEPHTDQEIERTEKQQRSQQVADRIYRLRRYMFSMSQHGEDHPQSSEAFSAPFLQALRYAASTIKHMDEISSDWQYPINPHSSEVAVQNDCREKREMARRFVQACGTIARLKCGTLEEPHLYEFFRGIETNHQTASLPSQGEQFAYDFLKAIVLWITSGPGAMIEGFTNPRGHRRQGSRLPIPEEDASIESIDDYLMPYLLSLATDQKIHNVDSSRFEVDDARFVFESEIEAVHAFAHAVRTPFRDLSSHTFMSGEHYEGVIDRGDALTFWTHKVARGVLLNVGVQINSAFVDKAFGGTGQVERRLQEREEALNRRLGLLDVSVAEEAEHEEDNSLARPTDATDQGTDRRGNSNNQAIPSFHDDENVEEMEDVPVAINHARTTSPDTSRIEGSQPALHIEDNGDDDSDNGDEDFDVDAFDEGEEDGESTDSDDAARTTSFTHATTRRHFAQSHTPCSTHTRVYKGHCNVRTVKDVGFYGLNDEYVVSGSDDGNFFIWDKHSNRLVNILSGDGETVNVVQPHPYEPLLAVSGIDSTIKIFSPDARARRRARYTNMARNYEPAGRNNRQAAEQPAREQTRQQDDSSDIDQTTDRCFGLPSSRRMADREDILSRNNEERHGGNRDAYITQTMLARIWARRNIGDGGGMVVNDDECRVQ